MINARENRKGDHELDNPETLATCGTKDTRRRQTKQSKKHNTAKKSKKMSNTNSTKKPEINNVLERGKQFLLLM